MSTAGGFLAGSIVAKLLLDRQQWSDSVSAIKQDQTDLEKKAAAMAKAFDDQATKIGAIGLAMVGALGATVKQAADEELTFIKLDAAIKSTGNTAGGSADQIKALGESLSKSTIFTHEQVNEADTLLLRFKSIGADIFPQATQAILDVASAMGTDATQAAESVGRALENPANATRALRAINILFTDDQRKAIKAMVEAGDTAGAQGLILDRLKTAYGGTAEMVGTTFNGTMTKTKNVIGEVVEDIGASLLPQLKDLAQGALDAATAIKAWADAHPDVIKQTTTLTADLGLGLIATSALVKVQGLMGKGLGLLTTPLGTFVAAIAATLLVLKDCAQYQANYNDLLDQFYEKAGQSRTGAQKLWDTMQGFGDWFQKFTSYGVWDNNRFLQEQLAKAQVKVVETALPMPRVFDGIATSLISVSEEASGFGVKLRDEVEGELKKTEAFLANFKGTAEATPGAVKELNDKIASLKEYLYGASEKLKTMDDLCKELGVTTRDEITKKIADATKVLETYGDKLPVDQVKALKDNIADWSGQLDDNSIKQNKLNDSLGLLKGTMDLMPAAVDDVAYAVTNASDNFKEWLSASGLSLETMYLEQVPGVGVAVSHLALEVGTSSKEMLDALFAIQTMLLAIAGIDIPDPFKGLPEKAKTATDDMKRPFDKLWSDIAQGFGDVFKKWAEGNLTFVDTLKGIWDTMKKAFFDFVGSLVTEWVQSFLKKALTEATTTAAAGASTAISGMGTAVTGLGTLATGIATTVATIITTLVAALSTAIVGITTAVATALVTMATAIASAATILAAAAPAIIVVGAIAVGLYAVGAAVAKLLGGGGKSGDVTYWLKFITENTTVAKDILRLNILGVLQDSFSKFVAFEHPIQDGYNRLMDIAHYSTWLPKMYQTLLGIEQNTKSGAQEGMLATEPTFVKVAERQPEIIAPIPKFQALVDRTAAGRVPAGGGGGVTLVIDGRETKLETGLKPLLIRVMPEWSADGILQFNVLGLRTAR